METDVHPVRLTAPAGSALQYHHCYSTAAYDQILGTWDSTLTFCYSTPPSHKSTLASRSSPANRVWICAGGWLGWLAVEELNSGFDKFWLDGTLIRADLLWYPFDLPY